MAVAKINVVFVIDGSASIGHDNFLKNFVLVRHIVQAVTSSKGLKFALLTFASRTRVVCGLTDDKQQFLQVSQLWAGETSSSFCRLVSFGQGRQATFFAGQ